MTDHTQRFTGRVKEYSLYREGYDPGVILPRLRDWCGLTPAWCIADIGAGTGMLTDLFLAHGNPVLAIEPNPEMRAACALQHPNSPRFRMIDATAENTTLKNHSVDMIAIGRALHWFNLDLAVPEFRRVLRPGGWVVSIAHGRADSGRPENDAVEALLSTLTHSVGTHASYAVYSNFRNYFPWAFHHEEIPGKTVLDWQAFRGLILSLSHSPLPGDPRFPGFEQSLRDIFRRFCADDHITLATRYWINAGQF